MLEGQRAAEAQAAVIEAIESGNADTFAALAEQHRQRLHLHCYRMLGSFDDAEDLVQETLLRAWRARTSFAGRAQFGTWLYRIATNACLNALERAPRRVLPQDVAPAITASTSTTPAMATARPSRTPPSITGAWLGVPAP